MSTKNQQPEWVIRAKDIPKLFEQLDEFTRCVPPPIPWNSPRNWPEDFPDENGKYVNQCRYCAHMFMGNKHRRICKECYQISKLWVVDTLELSGREYHAVLTNGELCLNSYNSEHHDMLVKFAQFLNAAHLSYGGSDPAIKTLDKGE